MSSLPTVNEFDVQWTVFRATIQQSKINLDTVNELIGALLLVTDSGGYGNIRISIIGGLIQEFKVEQSRRLEKRILKDQSVDTG